MSYFPNIFRATQDNGAVVPVAATPEGHVEIAIHDPRLPFGSLHTESLTPVFQCDAVYGLNTTEVSPVTGVSFGAGPTTGSNTGTNNMFKCSTGTTAYSFATIQSRKRLRYRAGQGVVGRFAGFFTGAVANSILVAGFGHGESGLFFGYNGTTFGVLSSTAGVRAVVTLTVTTASTATNNYNIVLNSATSVSVTATNNGSTVKTAYEISRGTYPGWTAIQRGSTVVFLASSVGARGGTYSIGQSGAATPAAGSYVATTAGSAATDTWVAQSAWNGDKLDGTGPSGVTLDPTKGNVFQIGIQYLGFGAITFQVEVVAGNGNNPTWVTVHTIKYPNNYTTVSQSNPSFPFTMAAYSAGSTTDCSVSVGSFAGFIEGPIRLTGPRMTYEDVSTAVSTGAYYCLFTIRNELTYADRANQAVVHLLSFGGAHDDATPVTLYLLRNATLAGTPNFSQHSTNSCTYVDTDATTATISANEQVVFSIPIGQGGTILYEFGDDVTVQPGETITVAAKAVTGTSTYTIASLNTREDQ